MSLYHYPDVYSALRAPSPAMVRGARLAINAHALGEVRRIMDPACGPANWLVPFAIDGLFVAGNDISPDMVSRARKVLFGFPHEIIQGDMRSLRFSSGHFDVAIELAGTVSQLDPPDFDAHLQSVAAHLRPGGLFLMTLFFEVDRPPSPEPVVSYQSGAIPLERGGQAKVTYEVIAWNPSDRREHMRRTVRLEGVPDAPPVLEDAYTLRIWREDEARRHIEATGLFDILDTDAIQVDGQSDPEGERTLVLRRRPHAG